MLEAAGCSVVRVSAEMVSRPNAIVDHVKPSFASVGPMDEFKRLFPYLRPTLGALGRRVSRDREDMIHPVANNTLPGPYRARCEHLVRVAAHAAVIERIHPEPRLLLRVLSGLDLLECGTRDDEYVTKSLKAAATS